VNQQNALAASVLPTVVSGNPTCQDLGLSTDTAPAPPRDYSDGIFTVTITAYKDDGEPLTFNWSATIGVDAVIVKGRDAANVYVYVPESLGDNGLNAPINASEGPAGLSHIEFCYDDDVVTETPVTETPVTETPTDTPTDEPTEIPTDTPTEIPVTDVPTELPTIIPPTDIITEAPTDPGETPSPPPPTLPPPAPSNPPQVLIPVTGADLSVPSPLNNLQSTFGNLGMALLGFGLVLQGVSRKLEDEN
jgi:hypothetical protein